MIWLGQQRNELIRLRIALARRLARFPDVPALERVRWSEKWLELAPFDPAAGQMAFFSLRDLGRHDDASALASRLVRKYRDAGVPIPVLEASVGPPQSTQGGNKESGREPLRQQIQFTLADDRTAIAWARIGDRSKPPLLKAANWLSHLELDWEAPIWSPIFRDLAEDFELVRYDERGCGLSEWSTNSIDFESFVTDLELVADAAGFDRFPLLGISQGAAVCIEYAARHPERVSKLVLFGGYDAGWRHTADPQEQREREAVMVLTEAGWGKDNPAYRQIFTCTFMPDANSEELAWFDDFQRRTTSPKNAVRFLEAFSSIDVRHRLRDVQCPTLVVHSRGDQRIPYATGLNLASQIPNAEFAGIDSRNHLLLGRHPEAKEFVRLVKDFLLRED
ncbi:alpha/beta hydrolase [Alteraurantiacibacter aquimixticola]|uniref:Alpha/beta hydrolase n=2 Tax=Alteraurantiacibacter aquimixticola TaxID=2489173 RepID=A0A4T3EYX8_9SPHN|nr:alpha/beta hydrolase [Alteraurantiacibacter aquimixticola]